MPHYRVTLAWSGDVNGATETWISKDTSLSGLGPMVTSLFDKRNDCVPASVFVTGVRISEYDAPRKSMFLPPGVYTTPVHGIEMTIPGIGGLVITDPKNEADQGRACLQLRLTYGDGYQVTRYMAFVPDAIIRREFEGIDWAGAPAFEAAFALFKTEIEQGGWMIRARDRDPRFGPKPIVKWVGSSDEPSDVGVQVKTSDAPVMTEADYVHISGTRRTGTDKMTYNGTYKISGLNYTLIPDSVVIYLNGTSIAEPETVKLPGKISTKRHEPVTVTKVTPVRAGVHKRGKPLGLLRGRNVSRAKLDP